MLSQDSRRLVVGQDKGEGAAFADTSGAAVLDVVEPLVALTVLAGRSLVLASICHTVANKGDRVVELLIPVELVLLKARVADIGGDVVERGTEYGG